MTFLGINVDTLVIIFVFSPLLSTIGLYYTSGQTVVQYRNKCLVSDNARCCYDNIASLCDVYKCANKLFWKPHERSCIFLTL